MGQSITDEGVRPRLGAECALYDGAGSVSTGGAGPTLRLDSSRSIAAYFEQEGVDVKTIETIPSFRHVRSQAIVCLLVIGAAISSHVAVGAESAQPTQDGPHYVTGDSWTYELSDLLAGSKQTVTQTVTLVHADGSALLQIAGGGRLELTPEANVIRIKSDRKACDVGLHFPLQVGTRHEVECTTTATTGQTVVLRGQSEIEDVETVNTKAGSFSAIKIKTTGTWSPLSGYGGGPMEETRWYAPAVKRVVRDEYQIRLAGKGTPATKTSELVDYSVKP
jgi:hypothetical protein